MVDVRLNDKGVEKPFSLREVPVAARKSFARFAAVAATQAPHFRGGVSWKDTWTCKWGLDVHSVVSDSIAFVAPAKGDFTPKNKAVLKKLGIHPLVMGKCGLYVNEFRPKIPKEADGCANHPEWIKNPTDHVNPSKENKNEAFGVENFCVGLCGGCGGSCRSSRFRCAGRQESC